MKMIPALFLNKFSKRPTNTREAKKKNDTLSLFLNEK